jgi:hypothetical protein
MFSAAILSAVARISREVSLAPLSPDPELDICGTLECREQSKISIFDSLTMLFIRPFCISPNYPANAYCSVLRSLSTRAQVVVVVTGKR